MTVLLSIIIAISLSMDAFSLALSIGVLGFSKKWHFIISLIVGVFHFFMPLFGFILGSTFINHFNVNTSFLSGIIFSYIAIQMLKEFFEGSNELFKLNFLEILVFSFGVSLDSFGVGFTMNEPLRFVLRTNLIFSICSFFFTFTGLTIGKKLYKFIGNFSILIGAAIMFVLSIINFCKFIFF